MLVEKNAAFFKKKQQKTSNNKNRIKYWSPSKLTKQQTGKYPCPKLSLAK